MNKQNQEMVYNFFYRFTIKTRGILTAKEDDLDKIKSYLMEDLVAVYGEDGFSIDELRPATPEEMAELEENLAQMRDLFEDEDGNPPVIN